MNQEAVDQIKAERDGWIAAVQDRDAIIKQYMDAADNLAAENKVLRDAAQQALDHCESYKFYGEAAGKHRSVCAALSAALTKEATNG